MIVGFVGSGNMAAAIARGWKGEFERMLFSDGGSGRAQALADELGGEVASNAEIAVQADFVLLAVKPAALDGVAPDLGAAGRIVSVLAAVPVERLRAAFPGAEVLRTMPNVGVEVRRGVLCVAGEALAAGAGQARAAGAGRRDRRRRLRRRNRGDGLRAGLLRAGGRRRSPPPAPPTASTPMLARELVVETAAGTAELLRSWDPAELRRAVASPGGSTEAGLEALDREGARAAFEAAVRASLERMRR